ncbi:F0F1 ATP synthase subunit epsilon [Tropicimonas isoalkanivorans]|uniref:ATP synthase epsilon chain n=1 Tax=Tropicimonas isoalkanivorans TaxID=441112 RepID=A0A1I1L2E0_9RHOB|nr:F0F1 ATP synthase subunit epsilon [Tropicimonas isoalkanivorans]SFC67237.1 F-type H+-transporting ATPase subunit epsilon [Tropicimonas isoalkanivorans]
MSGRLHLNITTPMDILVEEDGVRALRAEDESGGFGILPGHTDFLTVLPASVVRWTGRDGTRHFCALRGGLMTVTGGERVAIACREGVLGDDLAVLSADVAKLRADERDADRRARIEQMRLHASAVRQLMRYLRPGSDGGLGHPPSISGHGEGRRP